MRLPRSQINRYKAGDKTSPTIRPPSPNAPKLIAVPNSRQARYSVVLILNSDRPKVLILSTARSGIVCAGVFGKNRPYTHSTKALCMNRESIIGAARATCFYAWQTISDDPVPHKRQQNLALGRNQARVLCKRIVANLTKTAAIEWRMSPPGQGIPRITHEPGQRPAPEISISHCRKYIAVAISWYARPAIDVEFIKPGRNYLALASYLGWTSEKCGPDLCSDGSAFTRTWTQWECWTKAHQSSLVAAPGLFLLTVRQDLATKSSRTLGSPFCTHSAGSDGWLSVALVKEDRLLSNVAYHKLRVA